MNKRLLALLLSLGTQAPAFATCFQNEPLVPPSKHLKVGINVEHDGMTGFGESPVGNKSSNYPPKLNDADLKVHEKRAMQDGSTGEVSYFEAAPGGGWRVCRTDLWIPKLDLSEHQALAEKTKRYGIGIPLLEGLAKQNRVLALSTIYAYDTKGRIERIETAYFSEREKTKFKAQHCRRYDDKDNVLLWVNPTGTNKCPVGEPSLRDEWRQFKYAMYKGEQVELLSRWHTPKNGSQWQEVWEHFQTSPAPDAIRGHANIDSRRGVWEIFGSNYGKLDDNAANTVLDEFGRWKGSNYYFPKPPVPISVLEKPEELYKHERRRVTLLDSRTKLVELFKPNQHLSRHRFYTRDGYVLRHEQLDEKGKVRRIITMNDWRQPYPGMKPDFNDKLLSTIAPRLMAHKVYHRVYDVAPNGWPTLVAASWDPSLRRPFQDIPASMDNLAFGTPDGKVKWKSAEEFYKAFDTSDTASQVYPDLQDVQPGDD